MNKEFEALSAEQKIKSIDISHNAWPGLTSNLAVGEMASYVRNLPELLSHTKLKFDDTLEQFEASLRLNELYKPDGNPVTVNSYRYNNVPLPDSCLKELEQHLVKDLRKEYEIAKDFLPKFSTDALDNLRQLGVTSTTARTQLFKEGATSVQTPAPYNIKCVTDYPYTVRVDTEDSFSVSTPSFDTDGRTFINNLLSMGVFKPGSYHEQRYIQDEQHFAQFPAYSNIQVEKTLLPYEVDNIKLTEDLRTEFYNEILPTLAHKLVRGETSANSSNAAQYNENGWEAFTYGKPTLDSNGLMTGFEVQGVYARYQKDDVSYSITTAVEDRSADYEWAVDAPGYKKIPAFPSERIVTRLDQYIERAQEQYREEMKGKTSAMADKIFDGLIKENTIKTLDDQKLELRSDDYSVSGEIESLNIQIDNAYLTDANGNLQPLNPAEKELLTANLQNQFKEKIIKGYDAAHIAGQKLVTSAYEQIYDMSELNGETHINKDGNGYYLSALRSGDIIEPLVAEWTKDGKFDRHFSDLEMNALNKGITRGQMFEFMLMEKGKPHLDTNQLNELESIGVDRPDRRFALFHDGATLSNNVKVNGTEFKTDNWFLITNTREGIQVEDGWMCSVEGFFSGLQQGNTNVFNENSENLQKFQEGTSHGMHR